MHRKQKQDSVALTSLELSGIDTLNSVKLRKSKRKGGGQRAAHIKKEFLKVILQKRKVGYYGKEN